MEEEESIYYPPKPEIKETNQNNITKSLLSLGLFVLVFYLLIGDTQVLFMVVLILFIHEMGHFIAMKAFGYNGVNMFFIPLMGAMVTGQKDKISQLQRAIVVLAGPLPGILIGYGIIEYGQSIGHNELIIAGFMFLFINVMNLLPLDPLDGGKLIETLFFSSNESIKRVFLIISIALMVGIAILFKMPILAILGIFMFSRIKLLKSMEDIRSRIRVHEIQLVTSYNELTDKDYWLIRKEYLINSKLNKMIDPNQFESSQFEDRIAMSVRNILITPIEKDIPVGGKIFLLLLWVASLVIPIWYSLPYILKMFGEN